MFTSKNEFAFYFMHDIKFLNINIDAGEKMEAESFKKFLQSQDPNKDK